MKEKKRKKKGELNYELYFKFHREEVYEIRNNFIYDDYAFSH